MNMKIMQVVADIHAWDDFDLFWSIPAWIWLLIWNFEISMSKKTVKKATTLDFDVQIPFLFLHMDFILHLAYFCWTNMQGSSDLSVLTETGVQQAEKCRRALANINFDRCFASPISRAKVERDLKIIYMCVCLCVCFIIMYCYFHPHIDFHPIAIISLGAVNCWSSMARKSRRTGFSWFSEGSPSVFSWRHEKWYVPCLSILELWSPLY